MDFILYNSYYGEEWNCEDTIQGRVGYILWKKDQYVFRNPYGKDINVQQLCKITKFIIQLNKRKQKCLKKY